MFPYEAEFEKCASLIETCFCDFDFDQESQKITIHAPKGILLINWHGVAKEIWVSSPVTGAHHFSWNQATWKNTRSDDIFMEQIKQELDNLK